MKKLLALLVFALLIVTGYSVTVRAEGEIELYPYDKIECLQALDTCTNYKVGDSHWDLVYNGYRYNVVANNVRYVSEFTDANNDGFIDVAEMPAIGWNAFAALNINNTAEEVVLKTANARTDLTSVVHRIYAYFDETGALQMFEDHYVTKYYIYNDGTAEAPDWRLATQAEIDAYEAADPKPDNMLYTNIRIKLDDVDTDGYVLEPLASLKWVAQGVDTETQPVEEWSSIIPGDPNNVTIPAGWTVFSFGTLDRDGSTNVKTNDFIKSLVDAMVSNAAGAMIEYEDQPAEFTNIIAHDDDSETPGVNMIVDYGFAFSMPNDITASWINMFDDETGAIINETEMLDYSVTIYRDEVALQTINYTWDGTAYTADSEQTVIDQNDFGAGYKAIYSVTTPAGAVTEESVDIVVGVMPPKFYNVDDRFINEKVPVDLLGAITADDGYGNDKTNDIIITYPESLNPYYPEPGEYQIDLEFTHEVTFEAPDSTVTINGVTTTWDPAFYNSVTALSDASQYAIWTDAQMVHDVTWGWGRVLVLVGADGLVDAVYDRYTWDVTDETGDWNDGGTTFEDWKTNLTIEPGGFVIGSYGSTLSPALRDLAYNDSVSFNNVGLDTVTINGAKLEWDRAMFNTVTALNTEAVNQYAIFTNQDMARNVAWAWGSVMVLVGADGLVDAVYDRYTWDIDDETGAWVGDADVFANWKDNLVIEDGGFVIASHGSNISPLLRALTYDDPVEYAFGERDMTFEILTQDSYTLTVDDVTAPIALIVNDDYVVYADDFANANDAILANVVAFDNNDSVDDLAMYVSSNGGLLLSAPGTYTVEVTVEDYAGNAAVVSFDVTVKEARYTNEEVDALLDALDYLTPEEVQALIDGQDLLTQADVEDLITQNTLNQDDVQTLINDTLAETGCGSTLNISNIATLTVIVASGLAVVVFRKRF